MTTLSSSVQVLELLTYNNTMILITMMISDTFTVIMIAVSTITAVMLMMTTITIKKNILKVSALQ